MFLIVSKDLEKKARKEFPGHTIIVTPYYTEGHWVEYMPMEVKNEPKKEQSI